MAVPVNLFNPSTFQVSVIVNNGSQFAIPGTGSAANWTPQMPPGGGPGWSNFPSPGNFGVGNNQVIVAIQGGSPITLTVGLSSNIQWTSLQLYLFATYNNVTWLALESGRVAANGSTSTD
jgi:hypothetical protein